MGETTAIGWTDHTFNPWIGCTKVSPACDHCYAETLRKRTGHDEWGNDTRTVTSDAYWRNPLKWNRAAETEGRRHRVFCASLADVFEERSELDGLRVALWSLIDKTPWLDWQLLTKRPDNAAWMVPDLWVRGFWPRNVWLGTTVEDQEHTDRIRHLLVLPAAIRFLSCEPLIGPIDFNNCGAWNPRDHDFYLQGIDWVIAGGESGPGHRPLNPEDARLLRDQCAMAGVPFFFKQVGGRTPTAGGDLLDGVRWKQFPATEVDA